MYVHTYVGRTHRLKLSYLTTCLSNEMAFSTVLKLLWTYECMHICTVNGLPAKKFNIKAQSHRHMCMDLFQKFCFSIHFCHHKQRFPLLQIIKGDSISRRSFKFLHRRPQSLTMLPRHESNKIRLCNWLPIPTLGNSKGLFGSVPRFKHRACREFDPSNKESTTGRRVWPM
jgi:hypothetical protein